MGTEFSKADAHTANGISIRFPRFKCVRDKTWKQSTTLARLQVSHFFFFSIFPAFLLNVLQISSHVFHYLPDI